MFGNSNLQLPPHIFYGIKVWRLTRPLQDLTVLLLEPLLCCLGRVFWVIVMLEYPSRTHFRCPGWLQCPGPDGTWPRPSSTSMFDGGDGVLGVIEFLLLQTRRVELMPKSSILVSKLVSNRTKCCHLLTKLLGDGLVAHSSLV